MRLFLPFVFLAVSGVALPTFAKEFRIPVDAPLASIVLPEDWEPEFNTRGVRAHSPDNGVFLAIDATNDTKEMGRIIDKSDAMLKGRKITLDRSSKRDTKIVVNNFPAEELRYVGFDAIGSVSVTFVFVTMRGTAAVFTYVTTEEGYKNHQIDLGKIIDSIKALAPAEPAAAAR